MKKSTSLLSGLFAPVTSRLILMALLALFVASGSHAAQVTELDSHFQNPPEATKPWCYWYWLNNDISKEGVTKDLEAMAKVGIRLAMIGNIEGGGPVKMFSPEWYAITRHALKEANRLSIDIMMFNAPGWSQSGGPWVRPEQSMRRVIWNEVDASGGDFSQKLRPGGVPGGQDIAVLAVPRREAVSIKGSGQDTRHFAQAHPFVARSLSVHGTGSGKLYAMIEGERRLIAEIEAKGGNGKTDFLPNGVESFSFPDVRASEFELDGEFKGEVFLSSRPQVAQFIEKQMGRMHPTPLPTWESYIFPATAEPGDPATCIRQEDILDLSEHLNARGELTCQLPEGEWTILYFGMITTGKKNDPAPPEGRGLEVDKMSKPLARFHFNAMFGQLLEEVTPEEKAAWVGITIDSYEVGSQNWTDGFADAFKKRNGYDPRRLLPVMTGRVIDSAGSSDQFLWDLRRTVADMIAENYVGGLSEAAHEHDLRLWCENYGHWGFPGEFTIYGGYSDEIGGEFWTTGGLGPTECRAASSTGHTYGKKRIYAEAFTSGLKLESHPALLKARGEQMFCEGVNHFVLHVYAHQTTDGAPGKNPWFGTAFHRNTPWFNESRNWVRYLQRCHVMLQSGNPLADIAVYIGDFAPQMTGPKNPVPAGYDYDYIGSDAILRNLHVVDGDWVVYDEHDPERIAARWKLLAMPELGYIRPKVAQRLEALKQAGGQVVTGVPVSAATLADAGIKPEVTDASCPLRWKARRLENGGVFYLLSNFAKTGTFEATFRVSGKAPELFDPVTGQIRPLARYRSVEGGTRVSLDIQDPSDAYFLVFRKEAAAASVVAASASPAELQLFYDPDGRLVGESARAGSHTLTMSDGTERTLQFKSGAETYAIKGPWQSRAIDEGGYSIVKEAEFTLPANFGRGQRITLDLGDVSVMAKVKLNDQVFETLWRKPFTLDVTDALQAGRNQLQILVTSTSTGKPATGDVVLKTSSRQHPVEP